jgi:hypothetical protein
MSNRNMILRQNMITGERNTVLRSMHDTGLAAWFGGSLMGAIGLNGAAAAAQAPTERLHISSVGWHRWAPVNMAAIGTHLIGAAGILAAERDRVAAQKGVGTMTAVKTGLTVAALGATAYARMLGRKMEKADRVAVAGVTEPESRTPEDIAAVQRQQKVAQWSIPVLTGAILATGALAGEQQKPSQVSRGVGQRIGRMLARR